jgi:hypothetical protein
MNANEIEPGDSLILSSTDWRALRAISNDSSRLPEKRIGDAHATRSDLKSLVALIRSLPREGYEHVHITATEAQDSIGLDVSVSDAGVLRFGLPLGFARVWFALASETIDFLGDPEAHYTTGRTTEELRQAAMRLPRENWRPGI